MKDLLLLFNRYRIFVAITIQLAQGRPGNMSLVYYASQLFTLLSTGDKSVFIAGFSAMVKIAGVVVVVYYIAFFVDALGRGRPLTRVPRQRVSLC